MTPVFNPAIAMVTKYFRDLWDSYTARYQKNTYTQNKAECIETILEARPYEAGKPEQRKVTKGDANPNLLKSDKFDVNFVCWKILKNPYKRNNEYNRAGYRSQTYW